MSAHDPARDALVKDLYVIEHYTMEEIGARIGTSRERVRQLLRRQGVTGGNSPELIDLTLINDVLLSEEGITTFSELAAELEIPRSTLQMQLTPANKGRIRHLFHERKREHLLAALREIATSLGRTPSSRDLIQHRIWPLKIQTYFGSLSSAMKAAGLEPRYAGRYVDESRRSEATRMGALSRRRKGNQ